MRVIDLYLKIPHSGPCMNLYLMPDCHFGSPAFLEEEYERLAQVIENDPLAFLIFQGDILDSNRPSTRALKKVAYHDRPEEQEMEANRTETWIDTYIIPKLKRIIKDPTRCLMMDGDHHMEMSATGFTSTQYLCSKLKTKYLGDGQAIIRMHFVYSRNSGGSRANVVLHVQHGIGGAGRSGNNVNKLEDMAMGWQGIDVFMRGHSHRGFIYPISFYYPTHVTEDIRQKDVWLINTPSFRTGYVMGKTDYAEKRCYKATAHKYPVLHVSANKLVKNHSSLRLELRGELI